MIRPLRACPPVSGPARVAALALLLGGSACATSPATRPASPPPIVLVSLDTLRADHLGAYGDPRGLTPNLDRFAAESVLFEHAYSQATQTAPSHASLFTSRYPSELLGSDHQPLLSAEHPTLAQVLSAYGYQTLAFTSGGDLAAARGLHPGFDTWECGPDFGSLYHTGPLALGALDRRDRGRPWLLFVHGYDTHSRYLKPPPYGYLYTDGLPASDTPSPGAIAVRTATERLIDGRLHRDFGGLLRAYQELLRPRDPAVRERFSAVLLDQAEAVPTSEADLALVRGVYAGAVAYADAMFGVLMAGLEQRGVLDEAVVVVLSDHGEELGEEGLFGHCCGVGDTSSRVVLLVRPPGGIPTARRVGATVELVDVLPTLLELAGATVPAGARGRSLAGALRGEALPDRWAHTSASDMVRLVSVRGTAGRLSYAGLSATAPELPDLITAARLDGPGFTASEGLSGEDRELARHELVGWLRGLDPPTSLSGPRLPAALNRELREHGYWEVGP